MSKGKERTALSIRDRIVVQIYGTLRRGDGRAEMPLLTQAGIAEALNITRAHAAIELERGAGDLFYSEKAGNGKRMVKVYLLTEEGLALGRKLTEDLEMRRIVEESIDNPSRHSPARVLAGLSGADIALLGALRIHGPMEWRRIGRGTRVPFAVRNGELVQLSDVALAAVDRMLEKGDARRDALSLLADYCLDAGDFTGRLVYLSACGRLSEARRLILYHLDELQAGAPEEIADAVLEVRKGGGKPGAVSMLAARCLAELHRLQEAKSVLESSMDDGTEWELLEAIVASELDRRPANAQLLLSLKRRASGDREMSMYHRLSALSHFYSDELEMAERDASRGARVAAAAGDSSELRMNYGLLAKIERARGDFAEAARVESKLKNVGPQKQRGSGRGQLPQR